MKILFVLNHEFHAARPSNHLFETLISGMLSAGWEVHTIEKHGKEQTSESVGQVPGFEKLSRHVCRLRNVDKGRLARRYLADLTYVLLCIRHYRQNRNADVVFLQSCNMAYFHIFFIERLMKKPVLYNVQDIFPLNASMVGMMRKEGLLYRALSFLQRQAYQKADMIITISEDMRSSLVGEGVPDNKIHVIYNWSYSDQVIEIADESNRFLIDKGITDAGFKVVYAGNLGAVQNVDIALKAAEILKTINGIRFYVIGGGVRKNKLMKFAEENELVNVTFYPMQPSEYAPHIYSMADLNIIPLAKGIIKTALPSKTAFCLSCGKPIIACVDTDSKFSQMLGACENCHVVGSDDAEGLAACILQNFNEGRKCRSLEERELFKNVFSKEANSAEYIRLIKEMASADK